MSILVAPKVNTDVPHPGWDKRCASVLNVCIIMA